MLWPSKWVSLCSNPSNACGEAFSKEAHSYGETTNLLDTDCFHPVQARLLPPESALLSPTAYPQDDITSFPIRAFVSLPLEHDFVTFRTTLLDLQGKVCGMVQDLSPPAVWAHFLDDLPSSPAVPTRHLGLSKHAWQYLLFYEPDPGTVTCWTGVDIVIRCSAASSAVITEDFLLNHKLQVIEVKPRPYI